MALNRKKNPQDWLPDIRRSTGDYDKWFPGAAQKILKVTKQDAVDLTEATRRETNDFRSITSRVLGELPQASYILRQAVVPTLARDRLMNLTGVKNTFIARLERDGRVPSSAKADVWLEALADYFQKRLDPDLLPWVLKSRGPTADELTRALILLADRHSQACFNTVFRNEQERRQQKLLRTFLKRNGFKESDVPPWSLRPGEFRIGGVPLVGEDESGEDQNLPTDAVIKPLKRRKPLIALEMKSAGDFTNVNKRRKEESNKHGALHRRYGKKVVMVLQLFGYFDTKYLGFEGGAGIDWAWDHRLSDLSPHLGL